MNLKETTEALAQVVAPELAAGFTGRISFDIEMRQGGIAKISVRKEHDIRARTAGAPPVPVPSYREDGNSGRSPEWRHP